MKDILRSGFAALLLAAFFVRDVDAQSSSTSAVHTDTAFFHPDTVLVHAPASRVKLAGEVAAFISGMRPLPGLPPRGTGRIDLYLTANEREFTQATGGHAPHWGAGIAQPDAGVIVIPAYASRGAVQSLGAIVRHEVAHVQLYRALYPARIPRWFTEGYAVWTAGELDAEGDWYLRTAFVTGRAPPLDSLALSWPAQEMDARVAYLLSASAVAYLRQLGDEQSFATFLQQWRATTSMEAALRAAYSVSSAQYEQLWLKHVKKHYGWLLVSVQGVVASLMIGLVAIAMVFIRRRRDRRRLEELRRNEGPDAPAYWLETWVEPPDEGAPQGVEAIPEAAEAGPEERSADRADGLTQDTPNDRFRP